MGPRVAPTRGTQAPTTTLRRSGFRSTLERAASSTLRHVRSGISRFRKEWGFDLPLPGLLMMMPLEPTDISLRMVREVEGTTFAPVQPSLLHHLRESMAPVLDEFGLSLVEVQEHVFRPALREAGPISNLRGAVAPKVMAQNAVAAISVKINGAETGSAENYGTAKTRIDGIGATTTHRALTVTGKALAEFGFHMVTVATEGTPSHSKPGESPIGNPTIPIGTMYPSRAGLELEQVGPSGKVFKYKELVPIFIGMDVVECTEAAATTLEAYQKISGRPTQPKDTGAVCAFQVSDKPLIITDTYVRKFIVSPEIAKALHAAGEKIDLDNPIEENFALLARVTGRPIESFTVMSLSEKTRHKEGEVKINRPGSQILFGELAKIGIVKTYKFDDGDTPAVLLMARGGEVEFENGESGPIDVFVGDGGGFENVSAIETMANLCPPEVREYVGQWRYVHKTHTKSSNPDVYWSAHQIPADGMKPYRALGVDPGGTREASKEVGDGALIASSITVNEGGNPFAIAPEVNQGNNTVTVYQETASSDGSVIGRYFTFRTKAGIKSMERRLAPVLPDLMRIENLGELRNALQGLKEDPAAVQALKDNLRMYLYSLVEDSRNPDEPPYYLLMEQLILRRLVASADDQKALAVLRFATREFPELFKNPQAVGDSKAIVIDGRYTVTETDAESNLPAHVTWTQPA